MSSAAVVVYTTAPSEAEAVSLAETLVADALVACVNILPRGRSVYFYEGRVQNQPEWFLLAKTTADRQGAVIEAIEKAHPYDTPCVTVWPIATGSQSFLDWIDATVSR